MKGRLSHKKIYMLHRLINGKGDLIGKIMSSTGKCSSEYCFMLMLVSAADDSCLFRMRLWREYHGYINFWRIYNKCHIYIVTKCIWCVTLIVNYIKLRYNKCHIDIVITCIWCVTLMVNCIKLSHFLSWFCIFVILHIRHVHSKIIGRSVVLLSWSMRWLVGWFFGV